MEVGTLDRPRLQGPEMDKDESSNLPLCPSRFHSALVGATLNNMGNTCFMNAILQCITHTVPLLEKLVSNSHSPICSDEDGQFCSFCTLKSHIDECIAKSGSVVTPSKFAYNLSKISSFFQFGEQHDAHEFLSCFLDSIGTSYLKHISKAHRLSSPGDSVIDQVFGGQLKSQLRCCECGHCSDTYESLLGLSLEIDDVDDLNEALESFTQAEKIDDPDIKLTCGGCKAQGSMEKQLKIEQTPSVIALHLKRFKHSEHYVHKIGKFIKYPMELDLMPFLSCPIENGQLIYELYAIVVHSGSSYYGHYYCNIRTSPTAWHQMNDSWMGLLSETEVLDQQAYILFYIKKGSFPWFSSLINFKTTAQSDSDRNGSPSSVLDRQDNEDSPSAREASLSNSMEPNCGLEKDAMSSPHARPLVEIYADEPKADNASCSPKLADGLSDRNGAVCSPTGRDVPKPGKQQGSDDITVDPFTNDVFDDEKENHGIAQNQQSSKKIGQPGKVPHADKALKRLVKDMPVSRRLSFLACIPSSLEPANSRPVGLMSGPMKRKQRTVSNPQPLNGKSYRSATAKSLSPHSITGALSADDSDMVFEFRCDGN
ncbi:hypothetical protein HPP92_014610 [Vanilla planifolia]|uniref:USP domain-containing protein n=1 Tax=Vanilla planifolia TaxID=51239 RepID=A0A835QJN2_VANPL|nr:hypothetical protein HPP92_014610 [Vanilla planifolia]